MNIIVLVGVAVMMGGGVIREEVMGVTVIPRAAVISGTKTDGTGIAAIDTALVTKMNVRTGTMIKIGKIEMSIGGILIVEMGEVMVGIGTGKKVIANRAITKGTIILIETGSVVNPKEQKDIGIKINNLPISSNFPPFYFIFIFFIHGLRGEGAINLI